MFQDAVLRSEKPGVLGLLLLFQQWVDYKEGELVSDTYSVTNTLVSLMKEDKLNEAEQRSLSLSVGALLKSPKVILAIEQTATLGQLMYACHWKPELVLNFTLQASTHRCFESHILPHYITFCHSICKGDVEAHSIMLKNLATLIAAKGSLPKSGNDMGSFKIYPLEFTFAIRKSSDSASVPCLIQSILEKGVETMIIEDFEMYVNALICLPNVKPIETIKAKRLLKGIVVQIADTLNSLNAEEPQMKRAKVLRPSDFSEKLGLALSLAILGLRHFSSNLKEDLPWAVVRPIFLNEDVVSNVFYLRAADYYLTSLLEADGGDIFSLDTLYQIYNAVGQNLGSPFHEVSF